MTPAILMTGRAAGGTYLKGTDIVGRSLMTVLLHENHAIRFFFLYFICFWVLTVFTNVQKTKLQTLRA